MSEPSSKLDMNSLKDALDVGAETADDPTKPLSSQERAQETINKSSTLSAEDKGKRAKVEAKLDSPETLSPPESPAEVSQPAMTNQSAPKDLASNTTKTAAASPQISTDVTPQEDAQLDATTKQIKSMFPDLDTDTIQAVVVAEGGDFERAINMLLQMSDPSYVPPPPFRGSNQTEADEQLARSLAADEENRARREQNSQHVAPSGRGGGGFVNFFSGLTSQAAQSQQQRSTPPTYDPNNLTYQPRVRRTASNQATQQQPYPQQYQPQRPSPPARGESGTMNNMPWPGPKEAKQWQEDINKFAETGLAKAASTFSALRQRGEQAWANRGSPGAQQQEGYSESGAAGASGQRGGSFFAGWNQRNAGHGGAGSTVSPTIGSHRGFDRDPSPVGDNELAKILARGRSSNDTDEYDQTSGRAPRAQRQSSSGSMADRYKKVVTSHKAGNRSGKGRQDADDQIDDDGQDDAALGWDDAGRTGTGGGSAKAKSFEPIKITDNSSGADSKSGEAGAVTPTSANKTGQRNAVSLMEGSAGRGVTSPRTSTGPSNEKKLNEAGEDDDDDDDLEYVANPFEDED